MFLITLIYKKPLETVEQYLQEHRDFLSEGYAQNYFIVSGPQNPRVGGVIISQLQDRTTLEKFLEQDPFYMRGIADYKITEFTPVKYHPDFAAFMDT